MGRNGGGPSRLIVENGHHLPVLPGATHHSWMNMDELPSTSDSHDLPLPSIAQLPGWGSFPFCLEVSSAISQTGRESECPCSVIKSVNLPLSHHELLAACHESRTPTNPALGIMLMVIRIILIVFLIVFDSRSRNHALYYIISEFADF